MKDLYAQRLHHAIPGGAHTYSRGDDQFPVNAPSLLVRGEGAYVWDHNGTQYLDYGMALRAVTVGYAHPRVNQAAIAQIENGVNLTRPTLIELEAAETLIDLIPGMEMVKFAKNGSTVTTAAIKVARAVTGRKFVCIPRQHPFFSFEDWFIGTTVLKKGIPEEHYAYTLLFDYNDLSSLAQLFSLYPGQIACVLMEPATHVTPSIVEGTRLNFLQECKALCHRNGALFVLDEMITGFRWDLQGAQHYFNVEPDLCTFGKGMANGFSVAALLGKREFMQVGGILEEGAQRTFLISTTHGAEMPGLGAFMATVELYKECGICDHFWRFGRLLMDGINALSAHAGLQDYLYVSGNPISMILVTNDKDLRFSFAYRTLVMQELLKKHILMPWIAVSLAHNDNHLVETLHAFEGVIQIYAQAIEKGVDGFLEGPSVKPVFRECN